MRSINRDRIIFCRQCDAHIEHGGYLSSTRICGDCTSLRARFNGTSAAVGIVQREIKAGRLAKPSEFACVDCGIPAEQYDHRDYSKPLDVVPVCRRCNIRRGPGKWVMYEPVRTKRKRVAA